MVFGLPGRSYLDALADVIKLPPDYPVLILTSLNDEKKLSSIRARACGYLFKTALTDAIVETIQDAL